jgi:hypothetical protein
LYPISSAHAILLRMKVPLPRAISRSFESTAMDSAMINLREAGTTVPVATITPAETGRMKQVAT